MRERKSHKKRNVLIIFLIIGFFILNRFIFDQPFQDIFYGFIKKPGIMVETFILRVGGALRGVKDIEKIVSENQSLKNEDNILQEALISLKNTERENEFLREQLGVAEKQSKKLILAKIFNISQSPLGSVLFIDQGRNSGINRGMAVVGAGNVLYGTVVDIFDTSAKIMLIDDPRSTVSVRVSGTTVLANLKGDMIEKYGQAKLELVTSKDELKEGDVLVTSGLDKLPDGLRVGTIKNVEHSGGNLFKNVAANLFFVPINHNGVFVITE